MLPDEFETKTTKTKPNTLSDLLDAYRPQEDRTRGSGEAPGLSSWESARTAAHGLTARDWREDWKRKRRPPLKRSRDWKTPLLAIATVIILCLSVFAIYKLDALLDALHWHWMNPNEAEQPADQPAPSIHWRGQ